jgi:hypothetical protein
MEIDFVIPIGAEHQYRHVGQQRREVLGEQQGRLARPVQVFQHKQQRLAPRGTAQEFAEAVPHIAPCQLGWQLDSWWDLREGAPQCGRDTGDLRGHVAERVTKRD